MCAFRKLKAGGFKDEIRCDEPSYLIWKWHPVGSEEGNNNRENAIRNGSSLRVKEGEVAVFVYKKEDGSVQDFIEGPFDRKIETKNLPILASIVGLAFAGGTPYQAEIYFINLAKITQVSFGVPFFDVYDPRFLDFGVPVAVRGTIGFKIDDYREFIKLHRLNTFSLEDFQKQIRDVIRRYVKQTIINAPSKYGVPVVQIESKLFQVNEEIESVISKRLKEDFGVSVSGVDISSIKLDKTSEGYVRLMAVTKDVVSAKMQAEVVDYTARIRIKREEEQYSQHKQTQSLNLGAFQIEKQAEVGIAGAESIGTMGNGGNIGLGGNGINPIATVAGLAVGTAIGKNLVGAIKGSETEKQGVDRAQQSYVVPPIITQSTYYVAVNGQPTGPFSISELKNMVLEKRFSPNSLVWKQGMAEWVKAESVEEIKDIFIVIPQVPPIF